MTVNDSVEWQCCPWLASCAFAPLCAGLLTLGARMQDPAEYPMTSYVRRVKMRNIGVYSIYQMTILVGLVAGAGARHF